MPRTRRRSPESPLPVSAADEVVTGPDRPDSGRPVVGEVAMLAIDALRSPRINAKQHNESQVEQLMASIREFGFLDPIGIDEANVVIEGMGRVTAARRLGHTVVPILRLLGLSAREKRAYALAHNQSTLRSPLVEDRLIAEFSRLEVQPDEFNSLGFSAEDVLFLGLHAEESGPAELNQPLADDTGAATGIPPVLRSTIEFDDEAQRDLWYRFLEVLRERYPVSVTIAERVDRFVQEFGA